MNRKKNKQKNSVLIPLSLIIVAFIFMFALLCILYGRIIFSSKTKLKNYQLEINNKIATAMDANLSENLRVLNLFSALISQNFQRIEGKLLLEQLQKSYNSKTFFYVDNDGNAIYDGQKIDVSDRDYFQKSMAGFTVISSLLNSRIDNKEIIVYASPVFVEKQIKGVVVVVQEVLELQQILSTSSTFSKDSFVRLVDDTGSYIATSDNYELNSARSLFEDINNIFDNEEEGRRQFHNFYTLRQTGIVEHKRNGRLYANIYTPLLFNGWFVCSVSPINFISNTEIIITIILSSTAVLLFVAMIFMLVMLLKIRTKHEKELHYLVYTDTLTGKGNFQWFISESNDLIKQNPKTNYAVVSVNILHFNLYNQHFGRTQGDTKLIEIFTCIENHLMNDEIVARSDSDNFKILMNYGDDIQVIKDRLASISLLINTMDLPTEDGQHFFITICAGVCPIKSVSKNSDGEKYDFYSCCDRSSIALSTAKPVEDSFLRIDFFSEEHLIAMDSQKIIENRMEDALKNGEFVVYLQPKFSLEKNCIYGAEALVRWETADGKIEYPDSFIPIFENNGFILDLDLYVFEQVCITLRKWLDRGIEPVLVSVNLSRVYLKDLKFLHQFEERRKRYNVPTKYLELEITETAILEKSASLADIVYAIHDLGYKCSLDDFGAGYSSLNILKDIPVDTIKIDKGFFNGKNAGSPQSDTIVRSVIDLARELNMKTVSEGIESENQVKFLKDAHCDMIQGYYYSKPIKINDFEKMTFGMEISTAR